MRRTLLLGAAMCAVLLIAATSRSDVASTGTAAPTAAVPEPTTGTPAISAPGAEAKGHAPFTAYDPGPGTWSYAQLSGDDRGIADQGRSVAGWQAHSDAFARASAERAHRAAADSAAAQLGIDQLADTGVVP